MTKRATGATDAHVLPAGACLITVYPLAALYDARSEIISTDEDARRLRQATADPGSTDNADKLHQQLADAGRAASSSNPCVGVREIQQGRPN